MKKVKTSLLLTLLTLSATVIAGCGKQDKPKPDPTPEGEDIKLSFWSSFGGSYTSVLDGIVKKAAEAASTETNKVVIDHTSQGSYDKVKSEMMSALADASYPTMVTGYPDHFAEYLGNDILVPLDDLLKDYDKKHGTELLKDYFPKYMEENYALQVNEFEEPVLSALPFNKSTELMGYNGVFVDYCKLQDASLGDVPRTWQEWEVKGPKYRAILDGLTARPKEGKKGLCIYGDQDYEGKASNFSVKAKVNKQDADGNDIDEDGRKLLLNFTDVDNDISRIISWDSTDNMFITLIKQWGAEYTDLKDEEKINPPNERVGDVMFYSDENQPKVIECLKFFNRLNKQHIFGVPKEFQQSYSSKAFENNQVMFMLCSSGGLSYNTAKWTNRFRVSPLPYYDDGVTQRKYVISQGANITLTDETADFEQAFAAMVAMTTGELQAEWCLQTGYYPCSNSATKTDKYQEFLTEATPGGKGFNKYMQEKGCSEQEALEHAYEKPTRVAYREGSNVNETEYMPEANKWNKFVDAAFIGSSQVRMLVKSIFESVFGKCTLESSDKEYSDILYKVVTDDSLNNYQTVRVIGIDD